MNVSEDIVIWPRHYNPIPKPLYVVRCGDHFMVCECDDFGNLINEKSAIHWNKYLVRKWAFQITRGEK